jgi:glycosyltransferase involved in cell wall biosynthesis
VKVVIPVGALHVGGGCRVLAQVANALVAKRHDVEVVIPQGMPIEYKLHCKVTQVPSLQKEYIPYGDVVLPNFYTTFAPAFAAWPEKCVRLSLGYEPYWVPDPDYARWTYQQQVPVISISNWLADQIQANAGSPSQVVNLGVDRHVFHPKGRKKKRKRKVILYIARDPNAGYELKGYTDFVASMHILKQISKRKFTVYMICPERILPLPGIAHRTFQPQTDDEIATLYRAADVFVSTSWFEGFALPPLEAMACGTPVVTTNSGGILDFAEHHESALITSPRAPEELAYAVKRILNSHHLRGHILRGGLKSAREHSQRRFERRIVRALEKIHRERTSG